MTGAISSAALYVPIIASSGIFAARRVERGIDAMEDNPVFGTANLLIAGGQTLKGINAAKDLMNATNSVSAAEKFKNLDRAVKGATSTSGVMRFLGKVFTFISENVNSVICAASLIKVLGSDDKADAAVRETFGLGCMFTCEAAAKRVLGMPNTIVNAKGIQEKVLRPALYKRSPFIQKQIEAIDDLMVQTKIYDKISKSSVHAGVKGLLFVMASIAGYKIGSKLAEWALGSKESKNSKSKKAKIAKDTQAAQNVKNIQNVPNITKSNNTQTTDLNSKVQ